MSMKILTGPPGSGKSEYLIRKVQSARDAGQKVLTVSCCESLILQSRPALVKHGRINSRSGLATELDRFETLENTIRLLETAEDGWLLAFDEAQYFGPDIVSAWCEASNRGVDILIATPSHDQLKMLSRRGHRHTALTLTCQECGSNEASTYFCLFDERTNKDRTVSVCDRCHGTMKRAAEEKAVCLLREQDPYPGEEVIYQPVELSACDGWSGWRIIREDSERRFHIVKNACDRIGLPDRESNYLDIGCSTGFFCYRMSQTGFLSTGVDVSKSNIQLARLLGTYSRRDNARYILSDAYSYLKETQEVKFDVVSAFSIFQWVMIQNSAQHGLYCMAWMFRKSRYMCVLEMGVSTEDHYAERIGMGYDSDWIRTFMVASGEFDHVEWYEHGKHGLKRDLFIGLKRKDA